MITDQDKLACARRELGMRRRVYSRWVNIGKMKRDQAEREIALMEAIVSDYQAKVDHEHIDCDLTGGGRDGCTDFADQGA